MHESTQAKTHDEVAGAESALEAGSEVGHGPHEGIGGSESGDGGEGSSSATTAAVNAAAGAGGGAAGIAGAGPAAALGRVNAGGEEGA